MMFIKNYQNKFVLVKTMQLAKVGAFLRQCTYIVLSALEKFWILRVLV